MPSEIVSRFHELERNLHIANVNCQLSNDQKINCKPLNEQANISRQMSQITFIKN